MSGRNRRRVGKCRGRRVGGPAAAARRALAAGPPIVLLILFLVCVATAWAAPGQELWSVTANYPGSTGDDAASAVAVDGSGNPWLVGNMTTPLFGDDVFYASYTPDGVGRWGAFIQGPGAVNDHGSDIAIDGLGNAYLCGSTDGYGGLDDYLFAAVSSTGTFMGQTRYNGAANAPDVARALVLDGAGNAYVTGESFNANGTTDIVTVKYTSSGGTVWIRRFDARQKGDDRGVAIVRRGTSLYVVGTSERAGHGEDIVVVRYSSGGRRLWVRYYDGPRRRDEVVGGAAATTGAVYVAGGQDSSATTFGDGVLIKYGRSGARRWVRSFGARGVDEWLSAVAMAGARRLVVTGVVTRTGTGDDVYTASYDSDGRRLWRRYFDGAGANDAADALVVAGDGRAYVTGSTVNAARDRDALTLCYSRRGTRQWIAAHDGAANGDDFGFDVAVTATRVFVVGSAFNGAPGKDVMALGYER